MHSATHTAWLSKNRLPSLTNVHVAFRARAAGRTATPEVKRAPCTGMIDAESSVTTIVQEIRECGFVYIAPGWLPPKYITELYTFAQQYDRDEAEAYPSNAGGGRRDVIPPFKGPFAKSTPFKKLDPKFFDLLLDIVGNSDWDSAPDKGRVDAGAQGCCELSLLELKYAVPISEDAQRTGREQTSQGIERLTRQPWHRDNFTPQGHYYIFVALHNITSGLVSVIPNSQPGTFVDKIGCGSPLNRMDNSDPRKAPALQGECLGVALVGTFRRLFFISRARYRLRANFARTLQNAIVLGMHLHSPCRLEPFSFTKQL